MMNKSFAFLFLMTIFSISCSRPDENGSRVETLPYYEDADFTPRWYTKDDEALQTFHRISPFRLVDQRGDTINEKQFEDKIYVANFFFTTCPGICPKTTVSMLALQEEFKKDPDILLLSHSITPEIDSVDQLMHFAESKGIDNNKWHLVTGDREQIYKLGRQDYFMHENLGRKNEEDEFLHTENFILVDGNRHIRGIFNGLSKVSVNQLIEDIKTLRKEQL